eukprot:m.537135 g.537135  ORF g.537135 m.537135 type:complete len:196 (-) comp22073_c0_seq11:2806-3393(-)
MGRPVLEQSRCPSTRIYFQLTENVQLNDGVLFSIEENVTARSDALTASVPTPLQPESALTATGTSAPPPTTPLRTRTCMVEGMVRALSALACMSLVGGGVCPLNDTHAIVGVSLVDRACMWKLKVPYTVVAFTTPNPSSVLTEVMSLWYPSPASTSVSCSLLPYQRFGHIFAIHKLPVSRSMEKSILDTIVATSI